MEDASAAEESHSLADFPILIGKAPAAVILQCSEVRKLKSYGSAGFQNVSTRWLWRGCLRPGRSLVFLTLTVALPHRLFQFFLVIGKQSMNLAAVRFVADSVNLRTKLLPRCRRILVEQRLNLVIVLLKQRPDLLLLFRSQLQIFRKASKFLVD
jgi:hypothetical protein